MLTYSLVDEAEVVRWKQHLAWRKAGGGAANSINVSSHLAQHTSPSEGHQTDLTKLATAQLAIYATKINGDNFELIIQKIHTVINTHPPEVFVKYFRNLLLHSSTLVDTNVVSNPTSHKLIQHELKWLATDTKRTPLFKQILFGVDSELLNFFSLEQLYEIYDLTELERLLLSLPLLQLSQDANTVIKTAIPTLLQLIKENQVPKTQLASILSAIAKSEEVTTLEKVLLLNVTFESVSQDTEESKSIEASLQEFYKTLADMSFRDILVNLGPANILPERLLNDLLKLQAPSKLNEALSLLLAETISPGSQGLAGQPGETTALTPSNIPEASARGSQLGSIIRQLSPTPSWTAVFDLMNKLLPTPVITEASLSATLSALDDKTIDAFLAFDWSIDFKISLFVTLRKLDPQAGAFDLLKTNYLKPIIRDTSVPNMKNSILFFSNVTRLELCCISMSTSIQNSEFKKTLHQVFEQDIKTAPELIALGCIEFQPQNSTVDDLLESLMVHLLDDSHSCYLLILMELKDKSLLLRICEKIVTTRSPSALNNSLLMKLVESGSLVDLLERLSFETALEVAVAAVKVSWSDFDKFLDMNSSVPGFIEILMRFLTSQVDIKRDSRTTSVKAVHALLKRINNAEVSPALKSQIIDLQSQVLQAFPRLINFGFGHDDAILGNGDSNTFSFDIEQQMKVYYQRMYNQDLDIKQVIAMLQRLRDSDVPSDQDLFACMIHSLLDEYKFFPEYPLNALAITSVLFGSMIHFGLMRGTALSVALHYIFLSCNQSPDSNMFKFAVQAIYAFRQRLHEFPNYCSTLTRIASLKSQPQVYQIIMDVANNRTPESIDAIGQSVSEKAKVQCFKSVNPNSIIVNDVPQEPKPTPEAQQKIMFVLNNLTEENVDSKVENLKSALSPSVYQWLADYLVSQRVKTEPNNHRLYSDLLRLIGEELLYDHIISVTVDQANDLLNVTDESQNERNYLKNLGSWLGLMTLARNRPLKHRNIALKELLLEAHAQSKLALVIPFVCKVIDQSKSSEIFKVPNPWTLGLLKVLAELYEYSDLKLNLRFEIEVLCNSLKIELASIEPSTLIRKPTVPVLEGIAAMSLENKQAPIEQNQFIQQQQQGVQAQMQHQQQQQQQQQLHAPQLQQQALPQMAQGPSSSLPAPVNEDLLQNLLGSTSFVTNPTLKRVFLAALLKSIREILPPAVERAVSIAVTTARSLVLKDFATEGNETKLHTAALNVVRQLAESLALATCRDPLKESLQSTVHLYASQQHIPLEELPQAIVDNIELACGIIQKAAMEKACQEIDEMLVSAIAVRRLHKERRPDQPFTSQYLSRYALALPDPLGLKPSGVTEQQLQLYENFGRNLSASPSTTYQATQLDSQVPAVGTPLQTSAVPAPALAPAPAPSAPTPVLDQTTDQMRGSTSTADPLQVHGPSPVVPAPFTVPQNIQVQQMAPEQAFQFLQTGIESLLRLIDEAQVGSLLELVTDSPIRLLLGQMIGVISKNTARETFMLKCSQLLLNALFASTSTPLAREAFLFLIEKTCSASESARKDISWWLINSNDSRKFHVETLLSLFTIQAITPAAFDATLSKIVSSGSLEFTVSLITQSLASVKFSAYISDFAVTLSTLKDMRAQNENVEKLLTSLETLDIGALKGIGSDEQPIAESGRMSYLFIEWIRLLQNPGCTHDMVVSYINQLIRHGILEDFDNMTLFLRCAVETSVSYFKFSDPTNDVFIAADSFSKLLVMLIELQNDTQGRATTLKMAFCIITLVFSDDHSSSAEGFNERPYFRIFSSLLSEWTSSTVPVQDPSLNSQFYILLAKFLNNYQPLAFPGFSFAWITLISHRLFLPNILDLKDSTAESKFVLLLLGLLRFQSKHVKTTRIPEVFTVIYKGTLRIFLLLLHEYPDLLVNYHYQLCCEIPPSFIQLRNIVLSAFPRNISMPDPFTQGLKVDRLPQIQEAPEIGYNPTDDLKTLKKIVDGYLRIPTNMPIKNTINALKMEPIEEAGIGYSTTQWNIKLMNALVLYVGVQAVAERPTTGSIFSPKSPHFTLLAGLMQEGTVEFQYQFISAICNQLRYPNSHTHWFSHLILHFFGSQSLWNGKREQVQQVITRVLLERVICNRPHPWGLLITFVELLKNTELAFFELPFVKNAPEMQPLFTTLLRHFNAPIATNGTKENTPVPTASTAA